MTGLDQLPFLLDLLDDESVVVRDGVVRQLESFGQQLRGGLASLEPPPTPEQVETLASALRPASRSWLRAGWSSWYRIESPVERLETALALLSDYLGGPARRETLSVMLDKWAADCKAACETVDARSIAEYLFGTGRLRGARRDYGHPQRSDLVRVLMEGRGNPISLCCIYALVAHRLGVAVGGCNYPRHFLARFVESGTVYLVDAFHRGNVQSVDDVLANSDTLSEGGRTMLVLEAAPETIVARVLRNLRAGFQMLESEEDARTIHGLLRDLQFESSRRQLETQPDPLEPDTIPPQYSPGQVIQHERYKYRGVIVDCDPVCRASEQWYQSNRTQPDRNQPWYHVLVHDSHQVTYVAESNLSCDSVGGVVKHPLVPVFFDGYCGGAYLRNDESWPHSAPSENRS